MKISIRWALIFGCLGLIWGTQVLITSSTYFSTEQVLVRHARDIMQNIAELTMKQTQNHLALAQGAAHLTKRLIVSEVVSSDQNESNDLEKYFLDQLSIYPHFAGIYIGSPNGDFFYVGRSSARIENGYQTKIITHRDSQRQTLLLWRDSQYQMLDREIDAHDTYDPRERPWYQKVLQENTISWSDPYIFYTSQKPGITIAGPIHHGNNQLKAIVGVDIEIGQLSEFIDTLRIGKQGSAFMLNSNGDVVAFPDIDKIKFDAGRQDASLRLVKIEELDDGLSRAAYDAMQWTKLADGRIHLPESQFATFEYKNQTYHAMFTPFNNEQWPWIIGVYLPEDDYLGSINTNRRFNLLKTVALSLLATLIGLKLASGIIQPLAQLEKEALAIKKHDLATPFVTHSIYKEIQETADQFACMKVAIRDFEEKYRGIFDNIQDIYYEVSLEGRFLEVSPSVERILSYKRKELIGQPLHTICVEPPQIEKFMAILLSSQKVTDFELAIRSKGQSIEYCSINAALKGGVDKQSDFIIGSLRVITHRKRAEIELQQYQDHLEELVQQRTHELEDANRQLQDEIDIRTEKEQALTKSEEKYRSIIENMASGYYEADLDGNLIFFNDPLVHMLGYPKDQMKHLNYKKFMSSDTSQMAAREFSSLADNGGEGKLMRYEIIQKGGQVRTLEVSAALITDHSGQPVGYRGVVLDITGNLNAERDKKKLEIRIQQLQRLESIGTLAGGVAHDFNNILMGIQGNVSLMLMDMKDNSPNYERLKSIDTCVNNGADLTRQLLGFARGGKYIVEAVDINRIVRNTSNMFGRTRKEIRIHEELKKDLWSVMADQSQIEQVLLNIYINAWQAMPDGGDIHLKTDNVFLDEIFVQPFNIETGPYVLISVTDAGVGMDEEVQQRIFDPFFTTKEIGRGTGLGLASAFGIIKHHDGIIDFKSRPGEGTAFYIYLPRACAAPEETQKLYRPMPKGSETILLIDDEKVILDINRAILEELGYRVLTAQNGREAIERFKSSPDSIHIVILDLIMPDLKGGTVFNRLKKIDPDVKVILSSGYSLEGEAGDLLSRGCKGFIQKPFSVERLSTKIREVLQA